MSVLRVQWRHTRGGRPYVRLVDGRGRWVHVMRWDSRSAGEFWRLFAARAVVETRGAQWQEDFADIESVWKRARELLA